MHWFAGIRFLVPKFSFFFIVLFLFAIHTLDAHAQSLPGGNAGVHLIPSPSFPGPNEEVEITLDDYSVDTIGATISWYVNSTEQTMSKNERSIKITTGALGKNTTVRVVLSRNNTLPLTSTIILTPSVVDIIIEADTYVPNFYQGRALPSKDSKIRAIVLVHDNSATPQSGYVFKWSQNSTVLLGGPVTGKNILDYTVPHFGNTLLTVEVFKTTGVSVGARSVNLVPREPELHFYEYSPLRGLFKKEIKSPYTLISEETTLYGEPYFMNTRIQKDTADFTWKIDYVPAPHEVDTPNALTLRRVGGGGTANVEFSVVTKDYMPQYVKQALQLSFQ